MKSLVLVLGVAALCSVSVLLGCAQPQAAAQAELQRPLTVQEGVDLAGDVGSRLEVLERRIDVLEKGMMQILEQDKAERAGRQAAAERNDKRFDDLQKAVLQVSDDLVDFARTMAKREGLTD